MFKASRPQAACCAPLLRPTPTPRHLCGGLFALCTLAQVVCRARCSAPIVRRRVRSGTPAQVLRAVRAVQAARGCTAGHGTLQPCNLQPWSLHPRSYAQSQRMQSREPCSSEPYASFQGEFNGHRGASPRPPHSPACAPDPHTCVAVSNRSPLHVAVTDRLCMWRSSASFHCPLDIQNTRGVAGMPGIIKQAFLAY